MYKKKVKIVCKKQNKQTKNQNKIHFPRKVDLEKLN